MKQILRLSVASVAVVGTCAFAQSSTTIYGIVDAGIAVQNLGKGNVTQMTGLSFPSRLGFKGTEDLGGGLAANFKLEGDLSLANGNSNGFNFARTSTVGLSASQWGQVELGRTYTPAFMAVLNHDYSGYAYYNSMLVFTSLPGGATTRYSNGLFWTSPNWSGLVVRAAYSKGTQTVAPTDIGNAYGLSGVYTTGQLSVDAYYQADKVGLPVGSSTPTASANKVQQGFGARYDFSGVKVMGGYGTVATDGQNDKVTAYNIGINVPVGQGEILAQYMRVSQQANSGVAPAANVIGAVYRYFLSKRTTIYATAGETLNNSTGKFALFTTMPNLPAFTGAQLRGYGVGIQHNF